MRRQHPLFSAFGLIFTALLLAGLAVTLWRSGGKAFSPGALSAHAPSGQVMEGFRSHADFEAQCSRCHAPFKTTQDVLCLACHRRVSDQIKAGKGTHGLIQQVNRCADCHLDHQGRDFNIVDSALASFDHSQTRFNLVWHQVNYDAAPIECTACHRLEGQLTFSDEKCQLCHTGHDASFTNQHIRDFGNNCLDCHDGRDQMTHFNHTASNFQLLGKHTRLNCAQCHGIAQAMRDGQVDIGLSGSLAAAGQPARLLSASLFKVTPKACAQCHAEPPAHQGMFAGDCATCHAEQAWAPANWQGKPFNHAQQTGFSLVKHTHSAEGEPLLCTACHSVDASPIDLQTCIACHSQGDQRADFMRRHQEQFGPACLECHDGIDRLSNFDHARFFPLEGAHATAQCEACHAGRVFRGTLSACVECHAEPAIHAGSFGVQCQDCHTAQAWTPASLRRHSFPLNHGSQGEVPCKTCHEKTYIEYSCYGCHEHQPLDILVSHTNAGVARDVLPQCTLCHPSGSSDDHPLPGGPGKT